MTASPQPCGKRKPPWLLALTQGFKAVHFWLPQGATVYALGGGMPSQLAGGQDISFEEAAYELGPGGQGDFESPVLRLGYSSLATPHSTIDYNMATGKR